MAAANFFTLPTKDPQRENQLQAGEVLTEIRVPAAAGWRSAYDEIQERADFDWPLVSIAAAVKNEGATVRDARVVLGAVAPTPYRARAVDRRLQGRRLVRVRGLHPRRRLRPQHGQREGDGDGDEAGADGEREVVAAGQR